MNSRGICALSASSCSRRSALCRRCRKSHCCNALNTFFTLIISVFNYICFQKEIIMLSNIPIGKYGKYVPLIQTLLDLVIIGGVFLILLSIGGDCRFYAGEGCRSVWRTILIVGVVTLVSSRGCMAVHERRMMRAEKLFGAALLTSLFSTLLYAAMMMFTGYGHVQIAFFAYCISRRRDCCCLYGWYRCSFSSVSAGMGATHVIS